MYVILFLFWIIFNGNITVEIIAFGLVISAVILLFMCKFLDYSLKKELMLYRLAPQLIAYMFVLLWEVVKANVATAAIILNPKVKSEPKLFHFPSPLKTTLCRVILANSITLTPGTITVKLDDDGTFVIHCLDMDLAEGIEDSVFVRRLKKIEEIMEAGR